MRQQGGPLTGIRVVEMPAYGPVPFAGMMLADLGADVVRIDRPEFVGRQGSDAVEDAWIGRNVLARGKRRIGLDLKAGDAVEVASRLIARADVLIEGYRPGVMERLGLGPQECRRANPGLVYARATGWGQAGPLALTAGHDINYLALSGVLSLLGRRGQPPTPPLNLLADFGGGGMFVVVGVLAALIERSTSKLGQDVEAAMIDGVALLAAEDAALVRDGAWRPDRGTNMLDTGAYFYDCYETADGEYVAVGAVEPKFHDELVSRLDLADLADGGQQDPSTWEDRRSRLAQVFKTRSREEWAEVLDGTDACWTPVLRMEETNSHPHLLARETYIKTGPTTQPAPAPRFGRTPAPPPAGFHEPGADVLQLLSELGFDDTDTRRLIASRAVLGPDR